MNDLEILRTLAGPDEMPDPATEAKARAALLARATAETPASRRKWVFRVAAPVAAVAAAIAALGVVKADDRAVRPVPSATSPVMRPVSAVEALGYAADAATRQPFTVPRGDQWFYLETRLTTGTGPGGVVTGGPYRTVTSKVWRRIDGTQSVRYEGGKLVSTPSANAPLRKDGTYDYATLAALPPNPAAALAWVRREVGGVGGGTRDGEDEIAFVTINGILRNNVLPPAVEAAFFHALASLSGVTLVPGAVNVDGRPALAVARVQEGWLRDEILLDPRTYRLIGERSVAVADHTGTGDDGAWTVRKGTVERLVVRGAAAIVDRPGQTG